MRRRFRNPQEVALAVKQRVSFQDLLDHYGYEPARRSRGPSIKIVCPFHEDNDPSLSIHLERGLFVCFGCHAGGDTLEFLKLHESLSFSDAVRRLAEIGGVDLAPYLAEPTEKEKREARFRAVYRDVEGVIDIGRSHKAFREWKESRRLDIDILDEYGVGYSDSWSDLGGVDGREEAGLYRGQFQDAIVVPLRDEYGSTVGFRSRLLSGRVKTLGPKSDHPVGLPPLYGFSEARKHIRDAGHLVLVEGEVDCWQMAARGYPATCATMGTNLAPSTLEWLEERGVETVIVLPDADSAGRDFIHRLARQKNPTSVMLKVGWLGEGDPDEALLSEPQRVADAVNSARHVIHFALDEVVRAHDVTNPTGKIDSVKAALEVIGAATDIHREIAMDYLSEKLRVHRDFLSDYFRGQTAKDLYDGQAESEILALAIRSDDAAGVVVLQMTEDHFYYAQHRRVFREISTLYQRREPITEETVRLRLGSYTNVMQRLVNIEPTESALPNLVDRVIDFAIRRRVIEEARRTTRDLSDLDVSSRDASLGLVSSVTRVVVGRDDPLHDASDLVNEQIDIMHRRLADPARIVGLDFGDDWKTFNRTIHGLQESRYVVLAAASGVGKTLTAVDWTRRFAIEQEVPTLVMTFETGKEPYTKRLMSALSNVPMEAVTTGFMDDESVELVQDAARRIAASPLRFTEKGRTVEEALAIIRHDILKRDTGLVIVDYLQLMRKAERGRISRHEELAEISRDFLEITKDTRTRIVAIAQQNRTGAKAARSSKEDIGGAYAIAQDADIFLIVDEKTAAEMKAHGQESGNRYGMVEKNRLDGPNNVGFHLHMDVHTQRIREVTDAAPED